MMNEIFGRAVIVNFLVLPLSVDSFMNNCGLYDFRLHGGVFLMRAEVFLFSSPIVFVLESQSCHQMVCFSGPVVQIGVLFVILPACLSQPLIFSP